MIVIRAVTHLAGRMGANASARSCGTFATAAASRWVASIAQACAWSASNISLPTLPKRYDHASIIVEGRDQFRTGEYSGHPLLGRKSQQLRPDPVGPAQYEASRLQDRKSTRLNSSH